jgi:hypothetical protein
MASGRHADYSLARTSLSNFSRSPGSAAVRPGLRPGIFDQPESSTATATRQGHGLRSQGGGSIHKTTEEMRPPPPRDSFRPDPKWRSIQVPSTRNDMIENPFFEDPDYKDPIVYPDNDTRGDAEVAAFLGGLGPPPDIEDELDRASRAYFEREVIRSRNIAETSPQEAKMRSLSFERDRAVQTRDAIQVSVYTVHLM